jgi:ssRNA-specific RNase YbeY (16S rRNA maturation enzyme)
MYDSRAHLLHGVLHLNGFGHLLRVNGDDVTLDAVARLTKCAAPESACS